MMNNSALCNTITEDVPAGVRCGWVSTPDQRGTTDILWSCLSTMLLCLWTMLHLNVPAPADGYWTIFWRKARWLVLGILAPEVPMVIACGQWSSAKRSVRRMQELGVPRSRWTLEHAFFADSGGFTLQLISGESFPISAKQVEFLVQLGIVPLPTISQKEILDRSKADRISKALAIFQTVWLTTQTIGRAIQRMPITPLELATVALSIASLTTLGFWLRKPLDVETSVPVPAPVSLSSILSLQEKATAEQALSTPLDFVEPRVYMSRRWNQSLLRWILRLGLQDPLLSRVPNDRDPQLLGFRQHTTLGFATAAFACIHLLGWNFSFHTEWEAVLWRYNCLTMCLLLGVYGTAEVFVCYLEDYQNLGLETGGGYKLRWPACLLFFIPGGLYFCTRLCLIFEVVLSMFSLPAGAYLQVRWSSFIPHI